MQEVLSITDVQGRSNGLCEELQLHIPKLRLDERLFLIVNQHSAIVKWSGWRVHQKSNSIWIAMGSSAIVLTRLARGRIMLNVASTPSVVLHRPGLHLFLRELRVLDRPELHAEDRATLYQFIALAAQF
jgi:hypothetical protein